MERLILGGIQQDIRLPSENEILNHFSSEQLAKLASTPLLEHVARKLRLEVLLNTPKYRTTAELFMLKGNDYAVWLQYFPIRRHYEAQGNIQRLRDAELLGLQPATFPNSELYFAESVFLFLEKRRILDAALVGIPDDRTIKPICLARTFRFGVEYQRV